MSNALGRPSVHEQDRPTAVICSIVGNRAHKEFSDGTLVVTLEHHRDCIQSFSPLANNIPNGVIVGEIAAELHFERHPFLCEVGQQAMLDESGGLLHLEAGQSTALMSRDG